MSRYGPEVSRVDSSNLLLLHPVQHPLCTLEVPLNGRRWEPVYQSSAHATLVQEVSGEQLPLCWVIDGDTAFGVTRKVDHLKVLSSADIQYICVVQRLAPGRRDLVPARGKSEVRLLGKVSGLHVVQRLRLPATLQALQVVPVDPHVVEMAGPSAVVEVVVRTHHRALPFSAHGLDEAVGLQVVAQVTHAQTGVNDHVSGGPFQQPDVGSVSLEEVELPRQVEAFSYLGRAEPVRVHGADPRSHAPG